MPIYFLEEEKTILENYIISIVRSLVKQLKEMYVKSDQIHSKVQHSTANLSHCRRLVVFHLRFMLFSGI